MATGDPYSLTGPGVTECWARHGWQTCYRVAGHRPSSLTMQGSLSDLGCPGSAVQRAAPAEQQCEYGSLPGRWVSRGEAAPAWRLLDQRCMLRPLLEELDAPPPKGGLSTQDLLSADSCE
jgi:hypothetical protein